jgi:hypothetical protein
MFLGLTQMIQIEILFIFEVRSMAFQAANRIHSALITLFLLYPHPQ